MRGTGQRWERFTALSSWLKLWLSWLFTKPFLDFIAVAGGITNISGRLAEFLASGLWPLSKIVEFGALAYSGGACLTMASSLAGSLWQRLTTILGIYMVTGTGAIGITLFPAFRDLLPADARKVVGLYLLGLGLRYLRLPLGNNPALRYAMPVMMGLMIANLVLKTLSGELSWAIQFDPAMLFAVGGAVLSGLALTLVGMLAGLMVSDAKHLDGLKMGTGFTLINTAALSYFELPINLPFNMAYLTLGPLAVGLLWTLGSIATSALRDRSDLLPEGAPA